MVMNRPSNNAGNGVDTESTRDVLNRLDRTIRVLEGELAKPNPFQTRSQLMGQLREAKALKASLQTALDAGSLTLNQPLFDNKGMSTAIPGSFIDAVLKRAEATFGLFSNQFTINNGFGPKGPERGPTADFGPQPGNFVPKFSMNFQPMNYRAPQPTMFEAIARGKAFNQVQGLPGGVYPGLVGYIFGKDGTTPVQKAAGRPVPHKWPHTDGRRYVFADDLSEVAVETGTKVPGSTKVYYDANPVDAGESMVYDDGVYAGKLAIPPTPSSVTPAQSSGSKLYVPAAGDPVKGSRASTHVHDDSPSAAPLQFVVANTIPWVGSGSSHVFKTDGTPLLKAAGVSVPGTNDGTVYSEALGTLTVAPGVFVPGSGTRAGTGGDVRNKVYTSSVATNQLTWVAGADIPWDGNPIRRFNEQGAAASYVAGDAYPGQTNKVFDTDYSQYTKLPGKEVPTADGSGYDRTHPETADADGLGPAAQVYDASLQPVDKTRGLVVPGTNTVYNTTGAGASVVTVAVGDPVILPAAGQTSTTQVYDTNFNALTKDTGRFKPGGSGLVYEQTTPGNASTAVERDVATISTPVQVPDPAGPPLPPGSDPPPGHPMITAVHHTLRLLPGVNPRNFGQGDSLPYIFDPTLGTDPGVSITSRISQGQVPAALWLPGADHAAVSQPSAFLQPLTSLYVQPDSPLIVDGQESAPQIWSQGGLNLVAPEIQSATQYKVISNATDATGSKVVVQLQGTRSLMYAQGFGASTSTTSSSRSSGGFRNFMSDPRSNGRWY